jgi:hypothetical protein
VKFLIFPSRDYGEREREGCINWKKMNGLGTFAEGK